jgi:hypothetical protein
MKEKEILFSISEDVESCSRNTIYVNVLDRLQDGKYGNW